PDAGRVPACAADGVDERLPVRTPKQPRVERRQAPVLAVAEELVGRCSHAHVGRDVVAPAPCVEPVRRKADRHVRDKTDLARGASQLPVDVELEPHVIRNAVSIELGGIAWPAAPRRAVPLTPHVEGREFAKRSALDAQVGVEAPRFWSDAKDLLERARLELENTVVVDASLAVQNLSLVPHAGEVDIFGAVD